MKFMKLGSKPDLFQSEGDNLRYVATDLATDLVVTVGDIKFYLHKFPLLSKSARLQKLIASSSDDSSDSVHIPDIPGGAAAFEICAKFCYGMTVTLNAYNVVAARCAAEYLEMSENIEKGNLIYKIQVFLSTSIFRSWKDSIIVLQTTKSLPTWCEELKIISQCLDSISSKACIDTAMVDWSYSYNRKKLPSENGSDRNGIRKPLSVPADWWVEDLCELHLDSYKRVIAAIKARGGCPGDVIGEALKAYALRRLPGFSRGSVQGGDPVKNRALLETIICLLPTGKASVSCSFLLMLLKAAVSLECSEMIRNELIRRIGCQLHEAAVSDLLIETLIGEPTRYDIDMVIRLVEEFLIQELGPQNDPRVESEFLEIRSPVFVSDASKAMVAKLIDGYLAEAAKDQNLPLSKFVDLAERVSMFPRPSHDGIYRAIDMFLKEHPGIGKSEKKRICRLMDCKKLSADACMHAVQNERLPVRVVVQVLFFEQVRAATMSSSTDPHRSIHGLIPESHGSSRSATTNTDEEWDAVPTAEEIKALKGEIQSLKIANEKNSSNNNAEKAAANKMKNMLMSKRIFSKMWSSKDGSGENSSSDTSESHASTNAEESKSRNRHSLS
uniref:Uncharacterized protein n=1 Tax=Kalanchoe fedtschenkoi TaxID=63787 RepID=A0A7N0T543_KALFE